MRVLCLLSMLWLAGGAAASAASHNLSEKAREHLSRAEARMTLGDKRGACAELEEAFNWSARPGMLYDMGKLYRQLGDEASAPEDWKKSIEAFDRFLAAQPDDRERKTIEKWIAEMKAKVALAAQLAKAPSPEKEPRTAMAASHTNVPDGPPKKMKAPDERVEPRPLPKWVRPVEGVLGAGIGIGLAGVGLGAKLIADNGKPLCDLMPPVTQCPRNAATIPLGAGLTAGGGVLALGAAAAILYIELRIAREPNRTKTEPQPHVRFAPLVAPTVVGLSVGGEL